MYDNRILHAHGKAKAEGMSGRIWLEMNCYDKNGMLWHKSEL